MRITLISISLIFLLSIGAAKNDSLVGKIVPDFKLKNTDGKYVSMKNYKDAKGFVILFTSNHCPFARLYEDRLNDYYGRYKRLGYYLIAVNPSDANIFPDDSFDNMKRRASGKKYSFPYLQDQSQDVARSFGATKTPHVFVISVTEGGFLMQYSGAIDNNGMNPEKADKKYLENAVTSLVNNEPISQPLTLSIGCAIIWKK